MKSKSMAKKRLLLVLCFVLTSCTMDCVEPGLQSRNTSVNIDIPVHKDDDNVQIHWVNSDQIIGSGEKIEFTVNGSINVCHEKKGRNPVKVLVPAIFCSDGSEPDYDGAKDLNSNKLIDGLNGNEVCKNKGFVGNNWKVSNRRYVDTGIKVNPGDKLNFKLVPREIKIDCNKLKEITLDDNCYKTAEATDKNKVTPHAICKGGTFFCEDQDNKRVKTKLEPLEGQEQKYKVLVGNGYTPYDNKVHFNVSNGVQWISGSLLDLRRNKVGLDKVDLDKLCAGEKDPTKKKECHDNEKKKYSSSELNCYYDRICYNKEGIGNCISSIRREEYDVGGKCNMYPYLEKLAQRNVGRENSWAEALVAKIASSDIDYSNTPYNSRADMDINAKGTQCLPEKNGLTGDNVCSKISKDFEDFSLQLHRDYLVNNDVKPGSNVMLAIANNGSYVVNRGGYHVQVSKSCEFKDGAKLYIYVGDNHPSTASIDDIHKVEDLDKKIKDNVNYYIIDGSKLDDGSHKKIYFGIDVRNVDKKDLLDEDGKYYENNKYKVNLFMQKKVNDFISSNVNKIFNFVKGDGKDKDSTASTVREAYISYKRGLLQAVRALLTLYVIFSVLGYMLGTLYLSKHDFIVRISKVAFIAFVFSDKSWELFGEKLSMFFIGGSNYLVNSFAGYTGADSKDFAFLDITAGVLFTGETWLKFLSLMLSGPFGFIAFLAILYSTFKFLKCMVSAILKYIMAIVLGGFLLSLTPLFIVFILFQQTKPLFESWIKTLAHVTIQPVILFSSLSLLNQLMYAVLYNLTNFSACYQCLISINFLDYDFCIFKSILPLGYSSGASVDNALGNGVRNSGTFAALPIDLVQAAIYLIIASAMEAFVMISESMAQALFQSGYGITGAITNAARYASQSVLSKVGLDDGAQQGIRNIRGAPARTPNEIEYQAGNKQKGEPDKSEESGDKQPKRGASEDLKISGEQPQSKDDESMRAFSDKDNEESNK